MSDLEYSAFGFHPSLADERSSGRLHVSGDGVRFVHPGGQVLFPRLGLKLRVGGAADRIYFVEHESQPQWSVYTSDPNFLKDPILLSQPAIAEQIQAIRRKRAGARGLLGVFALCILALAVGLYLSKPWIVNRVAAKVPSEWEVQLGDAAFAALEQANTKLESPELDQSLQAFAALLTDQVKDSRYPYQFHVFEDDTLNAFALPGGHVVINSQAILRVEKGEDLLGVLAHEIGHVNRRHSIHALIDKMGFAILLGALVGDSSAIGGLLHSSAPLLNERSYSRDNERDADRIGLTYLQQSNIDPKGLIAFFQLIKAEQDQNAGLMELPLSFTSTHPATSERIATLEKIIAQQPQREYRDVGPEFTALKHALEAKLGSTTQVKEGIYENNP